MTTPSSAFPQGTRDSFDTGPLSWVMSEIRDALARSKASLNEAVTLEADTQSTPLRHAKTYLHQAHGALQMVDIEGVAIITETIEDMLDRMDAGHLTLTSEIAQTVATAYQALIEYLEELLAGGMHQPVRLFPYYRSLLEARGAERIHPADLFFPNLAIRPQLPPLEPPAAGQVSSYTSLRQRFERSLLPFLKSTEGAAEQANAGNMRDIIKEVEQLQSNPQSRAFWWVMHGFAEAVAGGHVHNELYVKQLFARINLQIRRLSEGSASIAERLLRDALFFIAGAKDPSPRVRQIRQAYQLDGQVPADYEKKRYGQIDTDALSAAKEHLSNAKNFWNRIAGGDISVAQSFEQQMNALTEAGGKLNSPSLLKLLRELSGIARHAAHSNPGDSLGLEMATSLLFVENALNQINHLSETFAERADAMTARLLSIVSGEPPAQSAQWLDEMSREAQQKQTMLALGGEMQSSLRQVEKLLDEYFRDPSQRAGLAEIEKTLHQIEGALAILDQDDAVRAIQHTQSAVKHFAESETVPELEEFQHVARNVGALSFFIETLQLQPDGAKKRFTFDDELGVFHANLIEKNVVPQVAQDHEVEFLSESAMDADAGAADSDVHEIQTVEEELAFHQQQSAELAVSLTAEPNNPELQEQLIESLEQVRLDATLLDNPEANDRAQAAIDILARPDFVPSQDNLAEIVTATAPVQAPVVPIPVPAAPATDEAIDAELLEIFLSEAEEVLECVKETVPESRNEPYNQDHLTTLRRSFHTLKGSGRMVGLNAFGEAAWSIEQVLNLRLSETRAGDADLYALLNKAVEVLGAWVEDLQTQGRSDRTPTALVRAAERIKLGGSFLYEEAPVAPEPQAPEKEPVPEPSVMTPIEAEPVAEEKTESTAVPEIIVEEEAPMILPQVEEVMLSDADLAALRGDDNLAVAVPEEVPQIPSLEAAGEAEPIAEVIDFPTMPTPEAKRDDNVKRIGDIEISVPLHNIYLAETDELVRFLSQDISEWRHEPDRHVNTQAVHAAHSLAGSSATVGFRSIQEVAHGLEMVLQYLARKPVKLLDSEYDTLEHGVDRIRFMLQMFALGEMPDHEPQQVQILEYLLSEISARAEHKPEDVFALPPVGVGPDVIAEEQLAEPLAPLPEAQPEPASELEILAAAEQELLSVFEAEPVPEPSPEIESVPAVLAESEPPTIAGEHEPEIEPQILAGPEDISLAQAEAMIAPEPEALPVMASEPAPIAAVDIAEPEPITAMDLAPAAAFDAEPVTALPEAAMSEPESEPAASEAVPADLVIEPVYAHDEVSVADSAPTIKDELDADLLPVFLEEGRDMLPQVGQALRSWQQKPDDFKSPQSLLRLLHTIKGSARMAGAMILGQHTHEMETRIEHMMRSGNPTSKAIDDLLSSHDQSLQLFEELQNPQEGKSAAAVVVPKDEPKEEPRVVPEAAKPASESAPVSEMVVLPSVMPIRTGSFAAPIRPAAEPVKPNAPVPLVRVRADILDRLVNQAGEVSISRSKLENEVGTLRLSLAELTENISRLRDQLREIEMQAETQITSRMAHSADREFDPLEFDRFTRLQELTRMMAESVNDVGSVQQNLARTVENANTDLVMQARLTRDLQQDLMRVRMIQFASISERLYRVTRQASKEVDKRVNLDIRGSNVEIDRGVLEKMAGPFEHLLRNAIVHGIESREARLAAGKNEVGELLVEIRQEGNEVVIQFSDDGQGLNLNRIRNKARETGLLADDEDMSDSEVTDLIFHPGFSTASEITELAGRGVGMDVVRSEAAGLGGRVAIRSEPGKGAHFTIHLPLTLAVTQVVILTTGGKTYAVPSVLVEQVQQLKTNQLAAAYNEGAVIWQGNRVPMYYLSTLLGDTAATAVAQQYSPLMILKSGDERVAIHVDEILGNREVVVKNIGPQLARMIGIAGATVLGSGEIVLILNPVPLAHRAGGHDSQRAPRLIPSDAPPSMGAIAEMAQPEGLKSEPVQGLRTQHIVMVVDDSLTVRRVTQRLLAREGYQVVLAKDGVDALEHLQSITPDVMLVDIEMPRMDGFDLTRNVRGDERTRHIPIIMITSRTATKHRNYAMELGVNEYLGKPYQEEALLNSIAGFVKKEPTVI